jgi:polyisoprenoid-binding protein YceI
MKNKIIAALLAIVLITVTAFTIVTWTVKPDAYAVTFKGKRVEGSFKGLKAKIDFDEANPSISKISATIDATTITTGNFLKNSHAKDGLGVDQYPQIKFESTSVVKKGSSYEATGNLTLKDVTKQIVMPFTFTPDATGGVFEGKFTIATADYHVVKSGTPETVDITIKVPVTKN